MLLSVIVPCYNQKNTIGQLLASLEKQTLRKSEFEVIIADDGSTDGSAEVLRDYKGALQVVTIFCHENNGRACARNQAFGKAQGQYLLLLDGDMTADPRLLENHLKVQKQQPDIVCLGKMVPAPVLQKDMLSWYRISRGAQKLPAGQPLPARYFATGNASLSKSLLQKTGGFNEGYQGWGGEDLEMGYQLEKAGAHIVFAEEALSFHHHAETLDGHIAKIRKYARSGLKQLIRNCPQHAESGYLRHFASRNLLTQAGLNFFFLKPWYAACLLLSKQVRVRPLAYRLYDYITYFNIYHAFTEQPHA